MISFLKSVTGSSSSSNNNNPSSSYSNQEAEVAQEALENLNLDDVEPLAAAAAASKSAEEREWQETIYDLIRGIQDPEKPETLEDLDVVREDLVSVTRQGTHAWTATVGFVPTIPHCSLATLIGLCLRIKLSRSLPSGLFKIDLFLQPGSHDTAEEITKQINDKERVCAAMENPHLREAVDKCIQDD